MVQLWFNLGLVLENIKICINDIHWIKIMGEQEEVARGEGVSPLMVGTLSLYVAQGNSSLTGTVFSRSTVLVTYVCDFHW